MPAPKQSIDIVQVSPQRQVVLGLLPLLLGIQLFAAIAFVPIALQGNADFRQFYSGGAIIRLGLRKQLYKAETQKQIEDSSVSYSTRILPINHPAYEYLIFSPLSGLSYRAAYLVWLGVNLGLLLLCYSLL